MYTPDRVFLVTLEAVESGDRFEGPNQISLEIVENGEECSSFSDMVLLRLRSL